MKRTSIRLNQSTYDWLEQHFKTIARGGEILTNCFPKLYSHEIDYILAQFSKDELFCILDACQGIDHRVQDFGLMVQTRMLVASTRSGDEHVHSAAQKLTQMTELSKFMLEIWVSGFNIGTASAAKYIGG